jgi:hypothetical protein
MKIAYKMGFTMSGSFQIDTLEKLARAARIKGRYDVIDVLREELSSDMANSVALNIALTPLYLRLIRKLEERFGLMQSFFEMKESPEIRHGEVASREEDEIFPPYLSLQDGPTDR